MSQRDSGYQRKALDAYETPEWVTVALLSHLPRAVKDVWEPATGSGKMADVLDLAGMNVLRSDILTGNDFLGSVLRPCGAIITNPPYTEADAFIQQALLHMALPRGLVAMLLRTDFDHAKGRRPIFAEHRAFAKKVVLTRRIQWFEDSRGSPSFNHAWFIWDWEHQGPPTLAYGP